MMLMNKELFGFLDIHFRLQPFAGSHAHDAAKELGDALDEEQDAGRHDHGLELAYFQPVTMSAVTPGKKKSR